MSSRSEQSSSSAATASEVVSPRKRVRHTDALCSPTNHGYINKWESPVSSRPPSGVVTVVPAAGAVSPHSHCNGSSSDSSSLSGSGSESGSRKANPVPPETTISGGTALFFIARNMTIPSLHSSLFIYALVFSLINAADQSDSSKDAMTVCNVMNASHNWSVGWKPYVVSLLLTILYVICSVWQTYLKYILKMASIDYQHQICKESDVLKFENDKQLFDHAFTKIEQSELYRRFVETLPPVRPTPIFMLTPPPKKNTTKRAR